MMRTRKDDMDPGILNNLDRYLYGKFFAILPLTNDGRFDFSQLSWMSVAGAIWSCIVSLVAAVRPELAHISATVPVTTVLTLWVLDMVTGTLRAFHVGGWRSWDPTRAKMGVAKLVLWFSVLGVTYVLRESHAMGAVWFGGTVEAYVIFTEAGSVLRNLGSIWGNKGVERAGGFVEDRADSLVDSIARK